MKDLLIVSILMFIATGIIYYLHKKKKQGNKCAGCPFGKQCLKARTQVCAQIKEEKLRRAS